MTADEIRLVFQRNNSQYNEMLLSEIAAQLAELNEKLNHMANAQGALDVVVLK